jgi:hypothetical protein
MIDYNTLDRTQIYVAFSEGNTLVSRLIKLFTRSRYSHSFLLYWDHNFNQFVAIGDDWNGWCLTTADTENTICVAETPVDLWKGMRANAHNLGSFYDYPGFIGMLWPIFGERFFRAKRQWRNPFDVKSWFICSEIATKVIQDSGLDLGLLPASTHPQRLKDALAATPGVIITESN